MGPLVLGLDAALGPCSVALIRGDVVLARRESLDRRGQSERLAAMADALLREAGLPAAALDAIGVTTGPGSFTGLRAAIALAEGMAHARAVPLFGVGVADALRRAHAGAATGPLPWIALSSRSGQVFLIRDQAPLACRLDDLPRPDGKVTVIGDAADLVAEWLRATGADATASGPALPAAADVARLACTLVMDGAAPGPVAPLYVDPPEARRPAGLRPAPLPGGRLVPVTPLHAEAIAAVHAASFPAGQSWDAAAFATLLGQTSHFGWLDPAGGAILARVAGGEAEILTLAVAPAARRRGMGAALLAAARARAAAEGATALFLEVGAGNGAALALYRAAGFRQVGLRPGYYAQGEDALVLRAEIAAGAPNPAPAPYGSVWKNDAETASRP